MREEQPAGSARALRLSVVRGGCAGMQYELAFTEPVPGDHPVACDDITVFLDPASEPFLAGSALDSEDALAGTGFRLHNPNAARSCGCGTSFEPVPAAS